MSPSLNVSKLSVTSFTYTWPVKVVVCSSCSDDDGVKSPIFPPDTEETTVQWQMKVAKIPRDDHLGLTVYGMSKNVSSVRASFALDMQTEDGEAVTKNVTGFEIYNFDPTAEPGWKEIVGWKKFCQSYFYVTGTCKTLVNKPVIFSCTVHVVDDQKDAPGVALFFKVPTCNLWQSMETMLTSGKDTDVTLVAKDKQKIKAHRAILKARSPVFDAMFSNQLSENFDNLVEIKDLDYEVLEKMIRFMYTGKASNLSTVADRLMMAADKYDLPMLRVMCEQEMGINLSVENAAQTLVLADLHHAGQLKKCTLNFIKHHAKGVLATSDWQAIKVQYPNLLDEVCQSLATMLLEN